MSKLWPLSPDVTQLGEKKFQKYRAKVVNTAKAVLATNPKDPIAAFDGVFPDGFWIKKSAFGMYWLPYGVFFQRDWTGKAWEVHMVLEHNPLNWYTPAEFEDFTTWQNEKTRNGIPTRLN